MRARILVSGIVQGVGFRYFTAARAGRLGVGGYVRNLRDGRVEIVADGERNVLDALIAAVKEGPSGATVRDVRVDWLDAPTEMREFVIR